MQYETFVTLPPEPRLTGIVDLLPPVGCLLYTSDAADDLIGVDLGGRRIIKKKKNTDSMVVLAS